MYSIGGKETRFTLLHLQEGEEYLKGYKGNFIFLHPVSHAEISEPGTIHFCSHSIILEPENNTYSIFKFLYKFMTSPPELCDKKGEKYIKFDCSRAIEIPSSKTPQPHKRHDIKEKKQQKVELKLSYSSQESFTKSVGLLYGETKKNLSDMEYQQVIATFMAEEERLGKVAFDKTRIKDINEKPLLSKELRVKQILPLVQIDGLFYLTDKRVYFQPHHSICAKPLVSFKLKNIIGLYKRRYKLKALGLEWKDKKGNSMYLSFVSQELRDKVYNNILEKAGKECATEMNVLEYMNQWVYGKISNFDYLMSLNSAAYRSFADLSQYPVFPWVLSNYKGTKIDLTKKENYRDLSKPMGALNSKRLADVLARYEVMPPEEKFLFGTHYSTPAYVISFLLRKNPLHMIKLQSGAFDNPNRLFHSISKEWQSALENPGNVRELIPEFYMSDPSFLANTLGLNLGIRANKKPVNDVKMPKWAKNAEDFLKIQREALEGPVVTENIHKWINLIFGYQQKGEEALAANNLFHPLSYEGSIELDKIKDPAQLMALEMQIMEFGQTPKQLFVKPHPAKYSYGIPKPLAEDIKEEKLEPKPLEKEEEKDHTTPPVAVPPAVKVDLKKGLWLEELNKKKVSKSGILHKKKITFLCGLENDTMFVTGSKDGTAKVFTAKEGIQKKVLFAREAGVYCGTQFRSEKIIAFGTQDNGILFYNQQNATPVFEIPKAHDDTVIGLVVNLKANMLISYSKDLSMKLWSFSSTNFPNKIPAETIFDHESKIRSADTIEWLLAAFDADGKVTIRDLHEPQDCVATIQIANVSKRQFVSFCDSTVLAVGTSSTVELYNVDGSFLNMVDLEEQIIFMGVQGAHLLATLESGKFAIIDWQLALKKTEAVIEDIFEGQTVTCAYLSKSTERIMFGTKSGAAISLS